MLGMVAETARYLILEMGRPHDAISGMRDTSLSLETIASREPPLSSFRRWTSSMSTRAMSAKKLMRRLFLFLVMASNFSGVVRMMSAA